MSSCGSDMFACSDDEDCAGGGMTGTCAIGGACAFPDADCESGQRYGDHAGAMSGECVPPADTTSGSDGGSTSAGSPTTLDPSMPSISLEDSATSPDATTLPLDTSTTDVDPTSPVTMNVESSSSDGGSTGEPNDDPDLLLWLRFDAIDDEGVVNDGVLGGYATCSGGCPSVAGGLGNYDGTSCLAFPHDDQLSSTTWSLATWVRVDEVGGYNLVSKAYLDESDNSWELFVLDDLVLGYHSWIEVAPGGTVSGPPPEIGAWMHLAATYDGGTLALYANGELAGELAVDIVVFDEHDVRIGCDSDAGLDAYLLVGALADVRVYKRALDETEIDALVDAEPPDP